MISETFFATNYTSVWRVLTPAMDDFVRRTNLDGYEREWPPLASTSHPSRRGLLNEAAFLLFARANRAAAMPDSEWVEASLNDVVEAANDYIGSSEAPALPPTASEKAEIRKIFERLFFFFKKLGASQLSTFPMFAGCGLINHCRGDVLLDSKHLYEVKAGDRRFRSVDYRQLLVYTSLHWSRTGNILEAVSLLNPRTGIHVHVNVEHIANEIAGQPAAELLDRIVQSFSVGLVSR